MRKTVAVIGAGYGGARAASLLDEVADVVLVDPKDAFVHNVAVLRGLTDPEWTDRVFLPYDQLLAHGRRIRDRAAHVEPGAVTLGSGERIDADYIVLATGSTYPFPAKMDVDDSAAAKARIHRTRTELDPAEHAVIFGAGAVGLELAAEIRQRWPKKLISVVDPAGDVLAGEYGDELRGELRRQLAELDVTLLLGDKPSGTPSASPGVRGAFEVSTASGANVAGDIWFQCFGAAPVTDYLREPLGSARRRDGLLRVTPDLRVEGQETVYAIGDIAATPEPKQAAAADAHARLVATNITARIRGEDVTETYEPDELAILVPLGATGGASQLPGGVVGAEETSAYKGRDLLLDYYRELFEPTAADVGHWIDENAHPLETTDVNAHLNDLAALDAMVGDASIVGLGMSTRAAHEVMASGHRVLRFLAEERGFRALAIHEDEEAVARLDTYARTGQGDPRAVLSEVFLPWRTQETLNIVEWARHFNQQEPDRPFRLVGLDPAEARTQDYAVVVDYAARFGRARADELRHHFDVIVTAHERPEHVQQARGTHPGRKFADHARDAYELVKALPDAEGKSVAVRLAARIVDFHAGSFTEGFDYGALRRRTVPALASLVEEGTRVVYWDGLALTANAERLEPGALLDPFRTVGSGLREHLGDRYVSLLIEFTHGDLGDVHFGEVAPPPEHGSLNATLAEAGPHRYLLDLRAPAPDSVAAWLDSPQRLRSIGGIYESTQDSDHYLTTGPLREWFDAVIHAGPITPTRLL